jgi:hypothetical protein
MSTIRKAAAATYTRVNVLCRPQIDCYQHLKLFDMSMTKNGLSTASDILQSLVSVLIALEKAKIPKGDKLVRDAGSICSPTMMRSPVSDLGRATSLMSQ